MDESEENQFTEGYDRDSPEVNIDSSTPVSSCNCKLLILTEIYCIINNKIRYSVYLKGNKDHSAECFILHRCSTEQGNVLYLQKEFFNKMFQEGQLQQRNATIHKGKSLILLFKEF